MCRLCQVTNCRLKYSVFYFVKTLRWNVGLSCLGVVFWTGSFCLGSGAPDLGILGGDALPRQIQKLYIALLGPGPVDDETLTFLLRFCFYYKCYRLCIKTRIISTSSIALTLLFLFTATSRLPFSVFQISQATHSTIYTYTLRIFP